MPETSKYTWVEKAAIPLVSAFAVAIYPFMLPMLEKAYGIEDTKREAVKTEIQDVMKSEETIESLSKKIEEHNNYYSSTLEDINEQIEEFNIARQRWSSSKAIVIRLYNDGQLKYTAMDGNEYPVYWNESEKKYKYIKNGSSYAIFTKE
jgi:uncharacterized membrane protein YhiD involved in acid resistance